MISFDKRSYTHLVSEYLKLTAASFSQEKDVKISKLFIAITLIFIISTAFAQAEQFSQVTLLTLDKSDFLEIHRLGLDILGYKGDSIEMIASQADMEWFRPIGRKHPRNSLTTATWNRPGTPRSTRPSKRTREPSSPNTRGAPEAAIRVLSRR